MKKIFVTVAEFLENGGELVEGRDLFDENDMGNKVKSYKWMPIFYKNEKIKNFFYVQIDCTPIYK